MSSELSVPRVSSISATEATHSRSAPPARGNPASPPPPPAGKALPNPTLRFDPALAIVVIEFRDADGAVRSSLPTEQQLDAYRAWDRGTLGEAPPGLARGGAVQDGAPDVASQPPVKDSATDVTR